MNKVKHVIKKQILNVKLSAGSHAYGVQEQLGRICRQTLPPALEQVCNAICAEKYWIKLNKISLDLDVLPVAALEEAMREKAAKKLAEALTAAIRAEGRHLNNTETQKNMPADPVEKTKYFSSAATLAARDETKRRKNPPASPVEILKYFLATGALPAWIDSRSVIPERLFNSAMTRDPEEISRFLRHAPRKNELCKRLAGILQIRQLKTLTAALSQTSAFDKLIDELFDPRHSAPASDRVNPVKIKESLLSYVLHYGPGLLPGSTVKKNGANDSLSGQRTLDDGIAERIGKGYVFKGDGLQKELLQQPEPPINIRPEDLAQSVVSGGIETHNGRGRKSHIGPPSGNEAQPCTVYNAGLVLLWPCIPSLFEACGLIKEDIFISEAAAQRAVLLLQYAVDGRREVPEFELPLNKILCGLVTDAPVATAFTPTTAEKAAVQEFLQTIIAEWSALKDSSPEALQFNYLQREGAIAFGRDHWQLDIKRQTRDILLDRLPWGIGVIKLPWMHQILYTTW